MWKAAWLFSQLNATSYMLSCSTGLIKYLSASFNWLVFCRRQRIVWANQFPLVAFLSECALLIHAIQEPTASSQQPVCCGPLARTHAPPGHTLLATSHATCRWYATNLSLLLLKQTHLRVLFSVGSGSQSQSVAVHTYTYSYDGQCRGRGTSRANR